MPDAPSPAPDVSVVVPVFNGERYLAEALASLHAQTGPTLEIIVVDDGSTDGSAEIARSVPGVRCLTQPNQGAAAAKNRGIEAARGTFLSFLDSDDRWPSGTLAARHAHLLASDAEVVFGRVQVFYEDGAPEGDATDAEVLKGLVAGTMLIRRADFLRVGLFDERFRVGEFLDWFARARATGLRAAHMDEVALERRIHAHNSGRDAQRARRGYAEVLRAAVARRRAAGKTRE